MILAYPLSYTQSPTALVTGGTRGIGAAIATRLAQAGAQVIVTGRAPEKRLENGFSYLSVDFSQRQQTEEFACQVESLGVDILINNAGINKISPFGGISSVDFDQIQEVNLRAPFLLSRAVLTHMRKKRWGRVVNMGSVFGKITRAQRGSYSTSKFGLAGLTAALAVEVATDGILVNCVSPGFIDTELTRTVLGETGIRQLVEQVPIRRLGKPEEIASFVAWLVSEENTFLTGQNLMIDGGFTCV